MSKEFENYVRNKNVILIGPAGYLQGKGLGKKFDKYDIIVRVKWLQPEKKDYGSRTDISYWYIVEKEHLRIFYDTNLLEANNVKWIVPVRYDKELVKLLSEKISTKVELYPKTLIQTIKHNAFTAPTTGVSAIAHLLSMPIKSLTVVGMDFHSSGYCETYQKELQDNFCTTREKIDNQERITKCNIYEWNLSDSAHNSRNLALFVNRMYKNTDKLILDKPMLARLKSARLERFVDNIDKSLPEISLLIPYKPSDEWRTKVFNWGIERYKKIFPEFEVCIGQTNDTPFNRSRAINIAASKATKDKFCIVDIDTLFTRNVFKKFTLETYGRVAVGNSFNLSKKSTHELLKQAPPINTQLSLSSSIPNISNNFLCYITRECFDGINGFDESFCGWGYEDKAFYKALSIYYGNPQTMYGNVFHIWHPHNKEKTYYRSTNKNHFRDLGYHNAKTCKDIIKIRGE